MACKAVDAGSIPTPASIFSPGGEIGKHSGLKIRRKATFLPVRFRFRAPKINNLVNYCLPQYFGVFCISRS